MKREVTFFTNFDIDYKYNILVIDIDGLQDLPACEW
jgi:hypothetical protein